jgi:hypothetical protein
MKTAILRIACGAGLIVAGWILAGALWPASSFRPVGEAEAVIGRPRTPVSYAGVARRHTVGVRGAGAGARGVGVRPGAGAGAPGAGPRGRPGNRGGPVNRVGRR